jgi:hypothetical protein
MASLLTKIITSIKKIMFTDDNLATAQIAKIFGSELMSVQESARTDAGSQPQIVKMHPKQFLTTSPQFQAQQKDSEQRILQALQREAENSYPLPEQSSFPPPSQQAPVPAPSVQQPQQAVQSVVQPQLAARQYTTTEVNVWEKINFNLERIAISLERVDISVKKRRIRRTSKTTA